MKLLGRAMISLLSVCLLVGSSFGDDRNDSSKGSAKPESSKSNSPLPAKPDPVSSDPQSSAGAGARSLSAASPSSPRGAAAASDMEESPSWTPMPALSGNPGMFTLETGEILPKGAFTLSVGTSKISRMPGDITALSTGPALGIGLTNWLSASLQFDANTHIHVDEPSLLSLNPVNSTNNQYNQCGTLTIYPSILPAACFPPAYVEDIPFASHNGGGVGELDLGVKIGLLSERRGNPISLAIKNDFYIPTQTSLGDLLSNQVQYGQFNYGIGFEASKTILGNSILATFNWSYRFTRSSSFTVTVAGSPQTEVLNLSDQMQTGFGLLMFPTKRFQIISEYSGIVYLGSGIQNTTFGARDPVDNVSGFRLYLAKNLALDAGYRYNLDLTNHLDRNGFVIKLSLARWPEKPRTSDFLTSTCSVDKSSVSAGSNDVVQANVNATDSYGHPLSFDWTATAGTIMGRGPAARWDSTGVAPGSYSITAHVDDGAGKTSTCSCTVTVQPGANSQ
jgi:hypothetical protein